jgi:hypothetical protein
MLCEFFVTDPDARLGPRVAGEELTEPAVVSLGS